MAAEFGHRLRGIGCLRDEHHAGLGFDDGRKTLAEDGVVLDAQDADTVACLHLDPRRQCSAKFLVHQDFSSTLQNRLPTSIASRSLPYRKGQVAAYRNGCVRPYFGSLLSHLRVRDPGVENRIAGRDGRISGPYFDPNIPDW